MKKIENEVTKSEEEIENAHQIEKAKIVSSLVHYSDETQIAIMALLTSDFLATIMHVRQNLKLITFIFEEATKKKKELDKNFIEDMKTKIG
jgi:hypothetical protein